MSAAIDLDELRENVRSVPAHEFSLDHLREFVDGATRLRSALRATAADLGWFGPAQRASKP